MIRWSFAFDEGHVAVEIRDEAEDKRIAECVGMVDKLLFVPTEGKEAYINLRLVKMIVREYVDETALSVIEPETKSEIEGE